MRALAALRPGLGPAELTAAAAIVEPAPLGIASPLAPPHHLASVVWADFFGTDTPRPLTRAEAMRVPAVKRARGIVCNTIARIELGDYDAAGNRLPAGQAAPWLDRTDSALHPFHRMLWTVDDVFFYGFSLWRRTNAAATDGGFPLKMDRVPIENWSLEPGTGRVVLDEADPARPGQTRRRVAGRDEVVLIIGTSEGLLSDGVDSVRHAADLHAAAGKAAAFPSAYIGLQLQPGATPLKKDSDDPTEVTATTLVQSWREAREGRNGGIAYLGNVEAKELGTFSEHLVIEGRNAAAVDIARHADIPADLIDATMPQSSLTYSTSRDNDRRLIDYGLGGYMSAISASLSVDGVHPRGRRVAFDLETWLKGDAAAPGQPASAPAPGLTPGAVDTAPAAPAALPPGETPQ